VARETVALSDHGRVICFARTVNDGLRYETMVNRARADPPTNVRRLVGRFAEMGASDTVRRIHLALVKHQGAADADDRRFVSTETTMPWRLHRTRVRTVVQVEG
jgi:hypothetical protein